MAAPLFGGACSFIIRSGGWSHKQQVVALGAEKLLSEITAIEL
ncbi:MAG: hypothetical protein U0M96_03510 [Eggerthellaceae bacterium]